MAGELRAVAGLESREQKDSNRLGFRASPVKRKNAGSTLAQRLLLGGNPQRKQVPGLQNTAPVFELSAVN